MAECSSLSLDRNFHAFQYTLEQLSIFDNHLPEAAFQLNNELLVDKDEVDDMLWTLFVILLVLWLLGVVSSYTMGGFIHLLLVLALIALVFQLITGRRTAL